MIIRNLRKYLSPLQKLSRNYPAAESRNNILLNSPPTVDLSQYQSVQNRPHQRPDIAIAVAASGGGYGQNSPFADQFSFVNTMNNLSDNNPLDTDYTGELFF